MVLSQQTIQTAKPIDWLFLSGIIAAVAIIIVVISLVARRRERL